MENVCKQCGKILDIHVETSTCGTKLKANESPPGAPNKKAATTDSVNTPIPEELCTELPAPPIMPNPQPTTSTMHDSSASRLEEMMHAMMIDMKEMKVMMKDSKDEASTAKEIACEARSAVNDLRTDIGKMQETTVTKDQVQSIVDTAVKIAVDTKLQSAGKNASDVHNPTTIVIGGLETMSFLEADDRIRRRLTELHLPDPLES